MYIRGGDITMYRKKDIEKLFCELCDCYYEEIFKYILVNVKNAEQAKDIVQQVFLIAYEKKDIVAKHENQVGFLYQTAKNLIFSCWRKTEKEKTKQLEEESIVTEEKDILEFLIKKKDKEIDVTKYIDVVLSQLEENKRRLYQEYYIEHLSMKEIAKREQLRETTVRMRFVRLRKEIKRIIKKLNLEIV